MCLWINYTYITRQNKDKLEIILGFSRKTWMIYIKLFSAKYKKTILLCDYRIFFLNCFLIIKVD